MYTDITIGNGKVTVLDEDELKEALDKNEISEKEFNLANETRNLLIESIKNNNNKYMNLDLESYLK